MRRVIRMNGKVVEHNGKEYEIIEEVWGSDNKLEFTTPDFQEVFNKLKNEYNHIVFGEDITEDEIKFMYFGFDGLKEKIENHIKEVSNRYYLTPKELDTVLDNMTNLHYSCLEGDFRTKPLFNVGNYESFQVSGNGRSFFKPSMRRGQAKINNSFFNTKGRASITLGYDSRSLHLEIETLRRMTFIKFVPLNEKFMVKRAI